MAEKVLLKFTTNCTYDGQEVGPDFFAESVEVEAEWSKFFLGNGFAEKVKPEPKPKSEPEPK